MEPFSDQTNQLNELHFHQILGKKFSFFVVFFRPILEHSKFDEQSLSKYFSVFFFQ